MFKYDSTHGRFAGSVSSDESSLTVDGDAIKVALTRLSPLTSRLRLLLPSRPLRLLPGLAPDASSRRPALPIPLAASP